MAPPTEPFVSQWRRAIRESVELSVDGKVAAYVLSTYMRSDGTNARPGGDRLVRGTGRSLRSVRRGIAELKAAGLLLEVVHGAPGRSSEYRAQIPTDAKLVAPDTRTRAKSAGPDTRTRAHSARVEPERVPTAQRRVPSTTPTRAIYDTDACRMALQLVKN